MTKPLDYYYERCEQGIIFKDSNQLIALDYLQQVYKNLVHENIRRRGLSRFFQKPKLVKGVYLWGGVGIGKTFLMDCFYNTLPFPNKLRMHFHQFMQRIHSSLTLHQGKKDPLQLVATELSEEAIVICFDEFFVSDITDAMLLARLLKALFDNGVCLVATSNVAPDDLYKNGLQRSQFLPAIALIKQDTQVVHLDSVIDYRLRHLKEAGVFYSPLSKEASEKMEKSFESLVSGKKIEYDSIYIHDRLVKIKKRAGDVIWFDFNDICSVPRSQNDYLYIAEHYRTVFISDIPFIQANEKDKICLFISLIDVFYDSRVRLVISSERPVTELYTEGLMILEYTRTHSRLLEMQSSDYFAGEYNNRT